MTTTQITTIDLDLGPAAGDFHSDYDWDAITRDYAEALESACGVEGVTICANGDVIATVETADQAREIDWREVSEAIDGYSILGRHEVQPVTSTHTLPAGSISSDGEHDWSGTQVTATIHANGSWSILDDEAACWDQGRAADMDEARRQVAAAVS